MNTLIVLLLMLLFLPGQGLAATKPTRIISLAPHTTELVFALNAEQHLVAVSEFSDYPAAANQLPRVANHNGVNFENVLRLKPDLILAWQGGNKPQDLARLASLGFDIFYSNPQSPEEIAKELVLLGDKLGRQQRAAELSHAFLLRLHKLRQQYHSKPKVTVFYYMWPTPLMTIGSGAWANQVLSVCGAKNVFEAAPVAYPEVTMEQVLKTKPDILVAAMKVSYQDAQSHWSNRRALLDAPLVVANPDLLHRFTPRLLNGIDALCKNLGQTQIAPHCSSERRREAHLIKIH